MNFNYMYVPYAFQKITRKNLRQVSKERHQTICFCDQNKKKKKLLFKIEKRSSFCIHLHKKSGQSRVYMYILSCVYKISKDPKAESLMGNLLKIGNKTKSNIKTNEYNTFSTEC